MSLLKLRAGSPGRFIVDVILNLAHVDGTGNIGEDVVPQPSGEAGELLLLQHGPPVVAEGVVSAGQTIALLRLLSQQVVLSSRNNKIIISTSTHQGIVVRFPILNTKPAGAPAMTSSAVQLKTNY